MQDSARTRTVIVGASVGGARTAQALRSEGYDGAILLLGEEDELPYDKPPLSKALLAGTTDTDSIRLLDRERCDALGITLRLGAGAERLDVAASRVELASGDAIPYDHLVVATGSRARPSPWSPESGLHVLRTLADSAAIRGDLASARDLVIVGAGFIGAEVAATARGLGLEVTVVDPVPVPMGRIVGDEAGELFGALHRRHGVATRFGVGVESVQGRRRDLCVTLTDGSLLHADTVIVGIGAQPNQEWLASSGLLLDNGVVCDQFCRSSAPDVFAVGDVSRWFHPRHGRHVRVEHWTNAMDQAVCVAHNIAHPDDLRGYAPVEYVWTDQYDWKAQFVGVRAETAASVVVGEPDEQQFAVLFGGSGAGGRGGDLTGAMIVNWPRAMIDCRRSLAVGTTVHAAQDRLLEFKRVRPSRRDVMPRVE